MHVVADPDRAISSVYGVSCWPTTVRIDADGVVRSIAYGLDDVDAAPAKGH